MSELIRCDGCRHEASDEFHDMWFTLERQSLARHYGGTKNLTGSGPWHFCSPGCILEWAKTNAKE